MALEPLKSPGLAQAQFALPAARDPKGAPEPGVLLPGGAAGAGVAAALHLMDRTHLSCCTLSFMGVQCFQLPPKKPSQQIEQVISTTFNYA